MSKLRTVLAVVLVQALALTACDRRVPLATAQASPEAVATAVLDALASNDRARLDALALGEREFRDHVWPELPAARPERNLPFSYVWGDLHQKSNASLAETLQTYRGQRFTLTSLRFAGSTDYASYRVHRDATLRVVDSAGTASDLRVCGSMLEKDGDWKVFSYVVD
jgi:hypothetical protein